METPGNAGDAQGYRDHSRRLTGFGILLIIIGIFHFLQMFLTLLSMLIVRFAAASTAPEPSALTYLSPTFSVWSGAFSLVLGIGSLRARRWVRPLILIRSWYSVGVTLLAMPLVIMVMKSALLTATKNQPQVPSTIVHLIALIVVGLVFAIKVGLSALFIWGFQPDDVRLTCEARNPSSSWTDRLPIPVLGWCIYMAFVGAFWFVTPLVGDVACFGTFLTGIAGIAVGWLVGGIYLFILREVIRRSTAGWTGSVVLSAMTHASGTVTLLRVGLAGGLTHLRISLPEEQLRPILQLGASFDWMIASCTALFGVASLAFLLWIRRYFVTASTTPLSLSLIVPS